MVTIGNCLNSSWQKDIIRWGHNAPCLCNRGNRSPSPVTSNKEMKYEKEVAQDLLFFKEMTYKQLAKKVDSSHILTHK